MKVKNINFLIILVTIFAFNITNAQAVFNDRNSQVFYDGSRALTFDISPLQTDKLYFDQKYHLNFTNNTNLTQYNVLMIEAGNESGLQFFTIGNFISSDVRSQVHEFTLRNNFPEGDKKYRFCIGNLIEYYCSKEIYLIKTLPDVEFISPAFGSKIDVSKKFSVIIKTNKPLNLNSRNWGISVSDNLGNNHLNFKVNNSKLRKVSENMYEASFNLTKQDFKDANQIKFSITTKGNSYTSEYFEIINKFVKKKR